MTHYIQGVLFDLDGTLTQQWFDFDVIRAELGIEEGPILEAIEQMDCDKKEKALATLHRWEAQGAEESQLNHGVQEMLNWLHAEGIKTGLVTRNRRQNAERVSELHGLTFDCIVSREDGPVKPDPFPVLRACEALKLNPRQVLMVGDFLFDMLSGRSAGAICVLITTSDKHWNYHEAADYVIDQFEELPELINRLESDATVR